MYQPTFEGEPTERTEIRIAYDDEYLYASGRFYDTDPSGVRSNSLYRDRYSGDDTFALVLDTFNDNENALWFYTSPAGVRFDQAVTVKQYAFAWIQLDFFFLVLHVFHQAQGHTGRTQLAEARPLVGPLSVQALVQRDRKVVLVAARVWSFAAVLLGLRLSVFR